MCIATLSQNIYNELSNNTVLIHYIYSEALVTLIRAMRINFSNKMVGRSCSSNRACLLEPFAVSSIIMWQGTAYCVTLFKNLISARAFGLSLVYNYMTRVVSATQKERNSRTLMYQFHQPLILNSYSWT